jgi:exosortase
MESNNTTQVDLKKNLSFQEELKRMLPGPAVLAAWAVVAVAFLWFYWSSMHYLVRSWWNQEDYQHGFFVPIFAVYLLWHRRAMIPAGAQGSLWGLPFFILWATMRWVAVYFNYGTLPELSMLPFFAGVAIFVGGWRGLAWSWPAIVFLFFMMPLPGQVQGLASEDLQAVATKISTYVIQTFGIAAVAQGNVIQLSEKPLEVARACSGLRMMMLFFALCIGAAFISRRPLWERLVMIASAAPIAVVSNVARIVITGVLYEIAGRWPSVIDLETSGETIHNWAGYAMMPIGLLLLLGEMSLLSKLMISPVSERPLMAGRVATPAAARAATAAAPAAAAPAAARTPVSAIPTTERLLQRSQRRRR